MKRYTACIPATDEMTGMNYVVSGSPMETLQEEALWHYNRSREHDGLAPLTELPEGTTFVPIY